MRLHSAFASSLLALAAATAVAPAAADTLVMTGTTYGSQNVDTSMTNWVGAGQFAAKLNGVSFATYCTDIYEAFAFNTVYSSYYVAPNGTSGGFTLSQADMLSKLYTVADNGVTAKVDTLDESAAFQLAVWEVMNETSSTWKLSGTDRGAFYVESGATSNQLTLANSWLQQAATSATSTFDVVRLASKGQQDMILAKPVSPIPEPSTYAMLLAGLGAVGFMAKRRRAARG